MLVLTDIENEPDDAMSMVRFLTYANQWDVEGLVATTSVHQQDKIAAWRIREIVEAYGKVRDNLEKHEPGYPDGGVSAVRHPRGPAGLRHGGRRAGDGFARLGPDHPGRGPRRSPSGLGAGVGRTQLSRPGALESPHDPLARRLEKFVAKLRVYTISDQDDSGPWIRKTFPNLFYIASPGMHAGGAYHHATWTGISGDNFHGRFAGADFSIVDNPWLDRNIRSKGPLGAQHPRTKFLMEGDTPSFLYLVNNGLGDPEHPDWGSWGGRYELYTPRTRKWFYEPETRPFWSDAEDEVLGVDGNWHTSNKATIWRWRSAYQNDFAARMDWTIKPYAEANHPPVAKLEHANQLNAKSGERVNLSAAGSTDPDGDALSYEWFYYGEPGTLLLSSGRTGAPLRIEDANKTTAWFTAPTVTRSETMHIVLAVTDRGAPPLTRYQRVIVTVVPPAQAQAVPSAQAQSAGVSTPAATIRWGADALRQKPEWYASPDAKAIADSVMQYQAADGGWPKNTDLGTPPPPAASRAAAGADVTSSTIDNNGTTMPMQFLALMTHATGEARYRASFLRGFDYLLAARYPNGGWPQFFPLRHGLSHAHHVQRQRDGHVLTVLRDAAAGKAPYGFVDERPPREGARGRVERASTSSCRRS